MGFAEGDLEEFDKVSAGLAWTRSLAAVRKGLGVDVDLEGVWEEHVGCEYSSLRVCVSDRAPLVVGKES